MDALVQVRKILASLTTSQRIMVACAAIAALGGTLWLSRYSKESDFKPLYTNLAAEDAGAVVQKLKESGADFRLSENGTTVLAPSARIAELRLEMASAGLPKSGRIGFELFDKTNFGATEFAEHVNYRRALEGELERSIMSVSAVEQARVHLTFPKDSVFLESRQPGKASVILKLRPGSHLLPQNVTALTNLVASAVESLGPEAVTLLDTHGNLLSLPKRAGADPDSPQPSDATLDYRQKLEANLLAKVNATLEPIVGGGRFRTGVSVDCDFTSGEQSEETLDPNKSVMLTSQKSEDATSPGGAVAFGTPGTASNLPRPPGRTGYGSSGLSRKTENISYQTSRVVRHMRLPQGTVKRISLSVLLDNNLKWEGAGKNLKRVLLPPTPEKLKTIRDLVSGIAGLSTERGDLLVVESLPFESTLNADPPDAGSAVPVDPRIPKWLASLLTDGRSLAIAAAVGAVMVLLLFGGLYVMLRRSKKPSPQIPVSLPAAASVRESEKLPPSNAEVAEAKRLEAQEASQRQLEQEIAEQLQLPISSSSKKGEYLVKHIRELIQKDSPSTTNFVRSWLSERGDSR